MLVTFDGLSHGHGHGHGRGHGQSLVLVILCSPSYSCMFALPKAALGYRRDESRRLEAMWRALGAFGSPGTLEMVFSGRRMEGRLVARHHARLALHRRGPKKAQATRHRARAHRMLSRVARRMRRAQSPSPAKLLRGSLASWACSSPPTAKFRCHGWAAAGLRIDRLLESPESGRANKMRKTPTSKRYMAARWSPCVPDLVRAGFASHRTRCTSSSPRLRRCSARRARPRHCRHKHSGRRSRAQEAATETVLALGVLARACNPLVIAEQKVERVQGLDIDRLLTPLFRTSLCSVGADVGRRAMDEAGVGKRSREAGRRNAAIEAGPVDDRFNGLRRMVATAESFRRGSRRLCLWVCGEIGHVVLRICCCVSLSL